jgi:dihydrofolate synthase/folylpolyglutamate synthase
MNYAESVAYIESLAPTILNPSLDRFALFMQEHERLQDRLVTIHIGGTNGKGSTVAIVDSVLRAAGLKVGRFTGPHLLRWNERFHVDGKAIDDRTFAAYATKLRESSEDFGRRHPDLGHLTWFEFLTAIAFFYFIETNVDVAVMEVGLGGRWDATNVLSKPLVSAITTIDLDHTHILGSTLAEIAMEKSGIIKDGVPLVTAAVQPEALQVIRGYAEKRRAPLYICQPPDVVSAQDGTLVEMQHFTSAVKRLALGGQHQHLNALVAATILSIADKQLKLNVANHLAEGFEKVYWPGRLQMIPELNLVLDGAHNVAGAVALRRALDAIAPDKRRIFLFSFFQNKDVSGALNALLRSGDVVCISEAATTRSVAKAEEVAALCREAGAEAKTYPSIAVALGAAQELAQPGELIVATGSFASVKEVMLARGWHRVEDGHRCLKY